jgi:hypothetical protein
MTLRQLELITGTIKWRDVRNLRKSGILVDVCLRPTFSDIYFIYVSCIEKLCFSFSECSPILFYLPFTGSFKQLESRILIELVLET